MKNVDITQLPLETVRRALEIRQQIAALENNLDNVITRPTTVNSKFSRRGAKRKRRVSPATRAKLAAIAKSRWRKAKASGKAAL